MTMQDMIFNAIKNEVENLGYDFIVQQEYSNTGKVYINKKFKSYLSFAYNFQSDNCTIQFFPANTKVVSGMCANKNGCILNCYINYPKEIESNMSKIFALLNKHLAKLNKYF